MKTLEEVAHDVEAMEYRMDVQDKVIKALTLTVEAIHEYNKVRDGQEGKT